jgi:hypothetical protein
VVEPANFAALGFWTTTLDFQASNPAAEAGGLVLVSFAVACFDCFRPMLILGSKVESRGSSPQLKVELWGFWVAEEGVGVEITAAEDGRNSGAETFMVFGEVDFGETLGSVAS